MSFFEQNWKWIIIAAIIGTILGFYILFSSTEQKKDCSENALLNACVPFWEQKISSFESDKNRFFLQPLTWNWMIDADKQNLQCCFYGQVDLNKDSSMTFADENILVSLINKYKMGSCTAWEH